MDWTPYPPTPSPVVRALDLIVCATDPGAAGSDDYKIAPPVGAPILSRTGQENGPVDLGRGVRLERIPDDDAEAVMDACTPRGMRFSPRRQFGQRYSLVRDVEHENLEADLYRWDPDGVLTDALTYSRLIRDNGYSTEYAARLIDFADGTRTIHYTPGTDGKAIWRLRTGREWLSVPEAHELGLLLESLWRTEVMSPRVRRALWRAEYSTWVPWADLANSTIVGGLEALLKVGRYQATRQFREKVPALANAVGVAEVDADLCDRLYDLRSGWVHGGHVHLFDTGLAAEQASASSRAEDEQQMLEAVARLQRVLRGSLRRAIEDPEFAATFADDEAVSASWGT